MQNVEKINALEDAYEKLSNEQLRAKSDDFRKKLRSFFVNLLFYFIFLHGFVSYCLKCIGLFSVRIIAHTLMTMIIIMAVTKIT